MLGHLHVSVSVSYPELFWLIVDLWISGVLLGYPECWCGVGVSVVPLRPRAVFVFVVVKNVTGHV